MQGRLPWTSPEVAAAWQTWGQIVAQPRQVYGGSITALLTGYSSGDYPMFANDKAPQCLLGHGALVAVSPPGQAAKPPSLRAGTD